ncbi:MAG: FlaA1/EpsC-like NDP-sugar epimerase, partial [Polaribacter sp.]
MKRNFSLKARNKYPSKWCVLFVDVLLMCLAFIGAYAIRFNRSLDFDVANLKLQLPIIILTSLASFLFVGSYKGMVGHSSIKDAFNVFFGVTMMSIAISFLVVVNQFLEIDQAFTIPKAIIFIHYVVAV